MSARVFEASFTVWAQNRYSTPRVPCDGICIVDYSIRLISALAHGMVEASMSLWLAVWHYMRSQHARYMKLHKAS